MWLLLIVLLLLPVPTLAQTTTPFPPTPDLPIPNEIITENAAAGDEALAGISLPDNPVSNISGDAEVVFGYAKWLLQPSTADELFGPFAPIIGRIGVFLLMSVAMAAAYTLAYFGIFLVRAIVWLINRISGNLILLAVVGIALLIILIIAGIWALLDFIF